jgi:hypothetical protein
MADWRPIAEAPKDGSRQWVKRVHRRQKIAEGWAVWNINSDDSPMRHDDENGPADIAYADTPRWLNEDRRYSFPPPTHWLPSKK